MILDFLEVLENLEVLGFIGEGAWNITKAAGQLPAPQPVLGDGVP